jgi:AcrR family transcriptional regulator
MPPAARPLRQDAELNRRKIIDAARAVFASKGIEAGHNEIAHHAGVAVGTVYRRFPDRDALITASLHDESEALIGLVSRGMESDDAWAGLSMVIREAVAMGVANRGLRDVAFASPAGVAGFAQLRDRIRPRMVELLARAAAEGCLRPGVTVQDLVMIMLMVTEFAHRSAAVYPDLYRRYLELLITSLRAGAGDDSSLPPAPDPEQVQMVARNWTRGRTAKA